MKEEPEWIDILAGLALVGLVSNPNVKNYAQASEAIACDAYKLAAAMMKVKEKLNGSEKKPREPRPTRRGRQDVSRTNIVCEGEEREGLSGALGQIKKGLVDVAKL